MINANAINQNNTGMRQDSLKWVRENLSDDQLTVELAHSREDGLWIIDGRHRMAIAKERGLKTIKATVEGWDADGNVTFKSTTDIAL
jgi:hypothetical protein